MNGTDWLWFAAGVATAFILTAAVLTARRSRWIRRHSYVAEVEIHDWRTAVSATTT